jgi:2-polyprenyl-6-hydroxyphenyl methylase/3-demethylubiquinone-9 3-methyltransferase
VAVATPSGARYRVGVARLTTRLVTSRADVVAFFDALAPDYAEAHGSADRLLAYRLGVIRQLLTGVSRGTLLEIGCGTAVHANALAGEFTTVIGTDISPAMIDAARRLTAKVSVRVDPAEELATVADRTVDVVLCVGALEHMPDQRRVLAQVRRVLRPGGRLVCLTPNGGYCWYRHLAPLLRRDVRHLSTDEFLTGARLDALLTAAGLQTVERRLWTFVPRGDVPAGVGPVLTALDRLGRRTGAGYLRGGIAIAARPLFATNRTA